MSTICDSPYVITSLMFLLAFRNAELSGVPILKEFTVYEFGLYCAFCIWCLGCALCLVLKASR